MADPTPGAPAACRTSKDLRTERLTLVSLSPGLAWAALEEREALGRALGARVPAAWPVADFARMLPRIVGVGVETSTRLIVHAGDRALIGEIGFHGPPSETGALEIGYSIIPEYRGRGFASEAARAVISDAFTIPGVRRVVAECLEDNQPSLRVLEKLGMRRVGSAGDTIRFELSRG